MEATTPTALRPEDFSPKPSIFQPDMSLFEEDAKLHVQFHRVPVLNEYKSAQAGRAVYDEKDFIKIHVPGDKNNVVDRPLDTLDKIRFGDKYEKWKAGQQEAISGTPLSAMPTMTPGKVAEYEYFNIKTIEQLSGAPDNLGQKMMGFNADKARAKAFLDAAAGNAPIEKMNAELAKRDEEIETLKAQMAALMTSTKGRKVAAETQEA